MAERPPVKRMVVGSTPTLGAYKVSYKRRIKMERLFAIWYLSGLALIALFSVLAIIDDDTKINCSIDKTVLSCEDLTHDLNNGNKTIQIDFTDKNGNPALAEIEIKVMNEGK